MNWLTSGKKRGTKAAKDHVRQHRQQHYRQQAMERKQNLGSAAQQLPPQYPLPPMSGTPIASGHSSQRTTPTPLISPISSVGGSEKGWSAGQGQAQQQQRAAPFAINSLPSKSSAAPMKPVARVSMDIVRLRKGQTLSRTDLGVTEARVQPAQQRPQGDLSSVFGGMFKEELGRLNLQQTQAPREESRQLKTAAPSSSPGPTGVGRFGHDEERPATAGSSVRPPQPEVEGIRFFNTGTAVKAPGNNSDKPPPPKQLSRFKLLLEEDDEDDVDPSVGFDMFKRKLRQSASGGGSAVKQEGDKGATGSGGLRMADLFRGAVPVGKQPCIVAAQPVFKPVAPMAVRRAQSEITPEAAVKPPTMVNAPPRPAPPAQSQDWSSLASKMGLFDPASHSKSKEKALLNFKKQKEAAAQADQDDDGDGFLVSPVKMKADDDMSPGFRMGGRKGRMPKPHDVLESLRPEVQAVSMFNRQLQMHEASQGRAEPEAAPPGPMPPLELSPKEDAINPPGSSQRPSVMSLLSQLNSPVPTLPASGVGRFASKSVSRSTKGPFPQPSDPSSATSPLRSQRPTASSTPMTAYDLLSDSSGSESASPLGGKAIGDSPVGRKRGRVSEGDAAAQHASTFANSLLSAADHEPTAKEEEEALPRAPASAEAALAAAAPQMESDGSVKPSAADYKTSSPPRPEKRVRLSPITPRRQARACHAEAAATRTPTGAGQVEDELNEPPPKTASHAQEASTNSTIHTLAQAPAAPTALDRDEEQRREVEALRREAEELRRVVEQQRATMADQQSSIVYYQLLARCLRVEAEQDAHGALQGRAQGEQVAAVGSQDEGPVPMKHLDNIDQEEDDAPPTPDTLPPDSKEQGGDQGDSAADDQCQVIEQVAAAEATHPMLDA